MSAQSLESYNRKERAVSWRRTFAREEIRFCREKRGIRLRSSSLQTVAKHGFSRSTAMMRNNEDAEDVVQESFSQGPYSSQELQRRFPVATWLSRIAINAALMKCARSTESGGCSG